VRPADRPLAQRALAKRLDERAEAMKSKQSIEDIAQMAAGLAGRTEIRDDVNLMALLSLKDEALAGWRLCQITPPRVEAAAAPDRFSRVVGPAPRDLVLISPSEEPPEGTVAVNELKDLRRMRLDSLARVRRREKRERAAGIPVGRRKST